jgi:hypothetical protein
MGHLSAQRASSFVCLLLLCAACGCGVGPVDRSTPAAGISGTIFGGQQPISSATVSVWEVGANGYGSAATQLGSSVTSGSDGTFQFAANAYTCPSADTQVYLLAKGGDASAGFANPNVVLAAGLGNCAAAKTTFVNINEVTTAATAFSLAQFFTKTLGSTSTDSFGSPGDQTGSIALSNTATIPTLVNLDSGQANTYTTVTTVETAKLNSIANTLAACVNDGSAFTQCARLFTDTTRLGDSAKPTDTLQAAVQMALQPWVQVSDLYNMATAEAPFVGEASTPNDWTVGISYRTDNAGLGILNGSATIDIDAQGNVWFPSAGPSVAGVEEFTPATQTFAGPYATGYGLVQPQYLAIDGFGFLWVTDQSSNNLVLIDTTPGDEGGFINQATFTGATALGPIAVDNNFNGYMGEVDSNGNNAIAGYLQGQTYQDIGYFQQGAPSGLLYINPNLVGPGLIVIGDTGTNGTSQEAIEFQQDPTDSGTFADVPYLLGSKATPGGIAFGYGENDQIFADPAGKQLCSRSLNKCFTPSIALSNPQGMATDGNNQLWVTDENADAIVTMKGFNQATPSASYGATSTVAYIHGHTFGTTMLSPVALAIDGSGNVWTAMENCSGGCTPNFMILAEVVGVAAPTLTPLSAQTDEGEVGMLPSAVHGGPVKGSSRSSLPAGSSQKFSGVPWVR